MSIFGWDYPPGCSSVPDDEPSYCETCGEHWDICECPECPECGEVGLKTCYDVHGMKKEFSDDGMIHSIEQFLETTQCGDTLHEYGRALYKYTFGPWIVATLKNGNEIYYDDEFAMDDDWYWVCDGVRVGSIIEGADYCAPPFECMFPFSMDEYDRLMTELEDYVTRHWEHNNSTFYKIREIGSDSVVCWCQWVNSDDEPKVSEESMMDVAISALGALYPSDEMFHQVEFDKWSQVDDKFEVSEYQEDILG